VYNPIEAVMIIEKPWGREEVLEINDRYMMKKLTMFEGHRCSIQFHRHKKETIYVLDGNLRIYTGPTKDELTAKIFVSGESITIEPGVVHRMEAVTDSVYVEASTPEMDDVVRLQDDYARVTV
jgi:mannose-6-phosphate isomerase-like protein (cupin superfamily)